MIRPPAGWLAALILVVASSCAPGGTTPVLSFGAEVPDDVVDLAEVTWERFLVAMSAKGDCVADIHLETSRNLPVRGLYEPHERVVFLRIPHTAPRLERTLVHEFAHHLEFSCPEHQRLREPFMAAQGYPPGTDWFVGPSDPGQPGERWAAIPSEQWAEAVTELVLGDRTASPTVVVRPPAADLVRAWTRGESLIGR